MPTLIEKWLVTEERAIAVRGVIMSCALLVLNACTVEPNTAIVHKSGTPEAEIINSAPDGAHAKFLPNAEFKALVAPILVKTSEASLKRLKALDQVFFRSEIIGDQAYEGVQRRKLLRSYNRELLVLANDSSKKRELELFLRAYEKMARLGCNDAYYGCRAMPVFKRASSSFDVWLLILDLDPEDTVLVWERLKLGRRLENFRSDEFHRPLLDLKYFAYARKFEIALEYANDKKWADEHYRNIERLLADADRFQGEPEYEKYIRTVLDIYIVEDVDSQGNSRRSKLARQALRAEAPKGLIVREWFEKVLADHYTGHKLGYSRSAKYIKKNSPGVPGNFNLTPLKEEGGDFFVVENTFDGVWSPGLSADLWKGAPTSVQRKEDLWNLIYNYVRLQMLSVVVESNVMMSDFYKNKDQYSSNNIHIEAVRRSERIRSKWLEFYDRTARVRRFAEQIFGRSTQEMHKLKIDEDSLSESVAYLVMYPHMIMLTYKMTVEKFAIKRWWTNIDGPRVLDMLFNGDLSAWFRYTRGMLKEYFTPTHLLYAYHFALKTGAFQAFDVKEDTFLRVLSEGYLKASLDDGRRYYEIWTESERTLSSEFSTFERVCATEKRIASLKQDGSLDVVGNFRDYSVDVTMKDMQWGLLFQTSIGKYVTGFQPLGGSTLERNDYHALAIISNTHEQSIDYYRVRIGERIKYMGNLLNVYRRHLETTKLYQTHVGDVDLEKIDKQMKFVSEKLNKAQHFSRRFFGKLFNRFDTFIGPCMGEFYRTEFDLQWDIVDMEKGFYRQLYKDFFDLKRLKKELDAKDIYAVDDARVKSILRRYRVTGFENEGDSQEGFFGYDKFRLEDGIYNAHRIDSTIRIRDYLKIGLRTSEKVWLAANDGVNITTPPKGLKELGFYINPEPYELNVEKFESAEEFAKDAVSRTWEDDMGDEKTATRWMHGVDWITGDYRRQMLPFVMGMYKLGDVEAYEGNDPKCYLEEPSEECLVIKRKLAEEDMHNEMFDLFSIVAGNERDHENFELFGVPNRGKIIGFEQMGGMLYLMSWGNGVLFNPSNTDPLGFFDTAYLLVQNIRLGWSKILPWKERVAYHHRLDPALSSLEKGKQYYSASKAEGYFVFPMESNVSLDLRDAYMKRVSREFGRINDLRKLACKTTEDDRQSGFHRSYPMPNSMGLTVEGNYLSYGLLEDQQSREQEFHKRTGYLFEAATKDEHFESCR